MRKINVEFHCHTNFSKDSLLKPKDLVSMAMKKKLDRVIITDHNSIKGAVEASKIAPGMIVIGEEIMTTKGELLAAFVLEELPGGLEPQEAIRLLRSQGAFISVSHPYDVFRSGHWKEKDLLEIIPFVDAIEVFNSRCMSMKPNDQAAEFAKRHQLAGTVGSDAHAGIELGKSYLVLDDFSDRSGLIQAMISARPVMNLSSPLIHLTSRYASTVKKTGLYRTNHKK
ncbi:MAG: PHP-associated domain-containing protein [Chloroflexota bacterium]